MEQYVSWKTVKRFLSGFLCSLVPPLEDIRVILHFEPSLDALTLRSDVISSIKIHPFGLPLPIQNGTPQRCQELSPDSQGKNLALTVQHVPYSLDSDPLGWGFSVSMSPPSVLCTQPHHRAKA